MARGMTPGRPRLPDRSITWVIQLTGVVVAGGLVLGGLTLQTAMPAPAQRALAVFLATAMLWLTKPVPLGVSSLLSVTALVGFGVVPTFEAAAAGYASRIVFFLLVLLLLGEAIQRVGLDGRLARRLLARPTTPRGSVIRLSGYMLLAGLFMPSGIARTVTFIPIVDRLNELYDLGEQNDFLRASFLLVGQVNPIGSLALMTGGGMAILSSEIIRVEVTPITWLGWALHMLIPVVLIYTIATLVVLWVFPVPAGPRARSTTVTATPMDRDQRIVALTMTATIGLWLVGSVTGLSTIVPPLLAVAVLTAPGVRILEASDIRRVNWNILLLFGAIMSLIAALQSTGALTMVIDAVLDVVPLVTLPTAAAVAMVLAGVVLIRLFFSTASASLAIMLPVVITVAGTLGVDPLAFTLATVLIVGSTTLVPFHLPTVLLVAEHYDPLRVRDVLVVGLISLAAAAVVTAVTWLVVWPVIGLS